MSKAYLSVILCLLWFKVTAQETFPINGVKDQRSNAYAFTNAQVVVDPQTVIRGGTLLIKDGKVVNSGTQITIPDDYVVVDLQGKYIYPSFIESYSQYGMPDMPRSSGFSFNRAEQIQSDMPGAYNANEAIKSHFIAAEEFKVQAPKAKSMRDMGFGASASFMNDGIARGTATVVALGDHNAQESMIRPHAATHYSLRKGSSSQSYPVSIMGGVALLRQTHFDADWYGRGQADFVDQGLELFNRHKSLPQIIEVRDWQEALTVDKVGDELGVQYIIKSTGDSYKRVNEIKATGATLIVPLDFPSAPDVEDHLNAERTSYSNMLHWELAPGNLAALEANGVPFVITSNGTKAFWKNLRTAIKRGLSEQAALRALTQGPAQMLGVSNQIGDLRNGKMASFIISDDSLFKEGTTITQHWIKGKAFELAQLPDKTVAGKYSLTYGSTTYPLEITVKGKSISGSLKVNDSTDTKVKISLDEDKIGMSFSPQKQDNQIRLAGWRQHKNWSGSGSDTQGGLISWSATYNGELDADTAKAKKGKKGEKKEESYGSVVMPFASFGSTSAPAAGKVLFKNATVWTNESEGILSGADVLVENGKIREVGSGLEAGDAQVIDASGMHLTSGVIDEHSHIALKSVNDIATVSAMVRMQDVVDAEDIDIYRQLSGGVTAAQLLHGSANPVGGQSAIVKLKWGVSPHDMLISDAKPYIKFALGENVKRSSNRASVRYPQSRMGVEQVFVDGFTQAQKYGAAWQAYNRLSSRDKARTNPPRRDLALEAMWEILQGERFITCHSYVQSEINMLMKVAERFGFKVQTFTHILEGYKVADKMANHGVGGSTFSDWWAYKYEVIEAIPYNATLMNNEGVVTAINSDNGEMGRRLNQEAAKSVKYGGMSEEDAWKMVSLNPAKLLQLDHRMGSIKAGKDADLVLWTDNPLSIYAIVDKTMVDGAFYFDRTSDKQAQAQLREERHRLIQKIMKEGNGGSKGGPRGKLPGGQKVNLDLHCEDIIVQN